MTAHQKTLESPDGFAGQSLGAAPCSPAVLLFRGRGVISALIRWQTRGEYSHAALLMPDGKIIESWQGDGVRIKTLSDWKNIDRFCIPSMTSSQWSAAIAFASGQVGRGYDYWAIVRFISRRHMPENQRWFCSELVFAALAHAGVKLFERIEPWAVSPGLLAISPMLSPANAPGERQPLEKPMSQNCNQTCEQPAPAAVRSSDGLARWDIDQTTGEAREWRLIAKEDIEGQEWTFSKGKRLRGFKDYRDGDWCVYEPGDYYNSRIFGVPESLLTIARPVKRANDKSSDPAQ